ncbi:MAG: mechanosensitive ion channel family protein [Verrucomicrobia bacterium]|nr:mechanosensitive ion channel family protein [Verrucomicrobiota bacterium]
MVTHGWKIGLIVLAGLAAWIVAGWLGTRLSSLFKRNQADDNSRKLGQTLGGALRWTLRAAVLIVATVLILNQLGVNVKPVIYKAVDWLITQGPGIVFTLILGFVALKVATLLAAKLTGYLHRDKFDVELQKRADTLSSVVRWVLKTGILIVILVMLLGKFGVEIGPIIAAAGIVGLAVGFGAQNLVQDVISGFFILLEDQVRMGDVVQLDGRGGLVERVTLRMIVLRDLAGNVHYVRNGKIDVVTNMTKEYSRYVFNIGVSYREDVDEVIGVIKRVDEELRADPEFKNDIIQPIEVMGLDEFADSALIIKARTTTKPIKQWRVGREFNRRLKLAFDKQGIEIPFPHLTLYPGKDKKGDSPSLKLQVEGGGQIPPNAGG